MYSKPFWFKMGNRPLKYDVKIKGQIVVIPAGTTNVDIAYGKSYMKYKDSRRYIQEHEHVSLEWYDCPRLDKLMQPFPSSEEKDRLWPGMPNL